MGDFLSDIKLFFLSILTGSLRIPYEGGLKGIIRGFQGGVVGAVLGALSELAKPLLKSVVAPFVKNIFGEETEKNFITFLDKKNTYEKVRKLATWFGIGGAAIGTTEGVVTVLKDNVDTGNDTLADEVGTLIGVAALGTVGLYVADKQGWLDGLKGEDVQEPESPVVIRADVSTEKSVTALRDA